MEKKQWRSCSYYPPIGRYLQKILRKPGIFIIWLHNSWTGITKFTLFSRAFYFCYLRMVDIDLGVSNLFKAGVNGITSQWRGHFYASAFLSRNETFPQTPISVMLVNTYCYSREMGCWLFLWDKMWVPPPEIRFSFWGFAILGMWGTCRQLC